MRRISFFIFDLTGSEGSHKEKSGKNEMIKMWRFGGGRKKRRKEGE
jgi:hypothetical protein